MFYGFIYCEVQQCVMKSAIITKTLQLPSKADFSRAVPCIAVVLQRTRMGRVSACWLGCSPGRWATRWPALLSRAAGASSSLFRQCFTPGNPAPCQSPLPAPLVLLFCSLAQSCDRNHSEKVVFAPLVCPGMSSLLFIPFVSPLLILG